MIMDNKEREGKHTNRKTNGDGKKVLLRGSNKHVVYTC